MTGPFVLPTSERLDSRIPPDIAPSDVARSWFDKFSAALESHSPDVANLFLEDSFWRDLLALSWDFRTIHGLRNITKYIHDTISSGFRLLSLSLDALRAPALQRPFDDIALLRFSFTFQTAVGKGIGTCNLVNTSGDWKAYTMFTKLEELTNYPESVGKLRNTSMWHGDWQTKRVADAEFANSNPTAVILGAGHVGLDLGARLQALGVRTLLIERNSRVGDSWRNRYKSLCLHDSVSTSAYSFPSTWPAYPAAAKLGDWLENYARTLELNVWTSSTIRHAKWDESSQMWLLDVQRDGTSRSLKVKHLMFATGWGANVPKLPIIADQDKFEGQVLHSTQYRTAEDHLGKKVVIVGACTSGHDIAYDFSDNDADVTMFQRSPTMVVGSQTLDKTLLSPLYNEDIPTDIADQISSSLPFNVSRQFHRRIFTTVAAVMDKVLLDGLAKVGFKTYLGPDDSGVMPLVYERGGGYYLDTGASQRIIDRKIKLKSGGNIKRFTAHGLEFSDGSHLDADLVVFATGYGDPRAMAKEICDPEVFAKLKPLWGLDPEGEVRSAWRESGHKKLWFAVGHFSMARIFSKLLALRIKAEEEGLIRQ
ncbi:FAD/NAD(P)-binding domain-containing protein [Laetiporus sulphureus 93-53]|uniref:FAD/NAD(P)-binding domain-containing protein n=1 Tax=Laetiporus sulphureus 93-53 TaxID=1314785 RepID=A0A165GHH1_9APHY|nr:FAD/NAD(P)-binding domain-containing protein [Laetiporus sulphureus 93-53]KZT10354.1 FAD/NAD(P)-binding domain-containing protein [Laetiporus sulphureus 93-53]